MIKNIEINNKTIKNITEKLDYTIESVEDRVKHLNSILAPESKEDGVFEEYYIKAAENIKMTMGENDMSRNLEYMANYLLYSKDCLEENDNSEYPYETNNTFAKRKKKEILVDDFTKNYSGRESAKPFNNTQPPNIITNAYGDANKKNIRKYPKERILSKDLNCPNIADIQIAIDKLRIKLNTDESLTKSKRNKIRTILRELRSEQIEIKGIICKPIKFKQVSPSSTKYCFEGIDMFSPGDIHALLQNYSILKEDSNFDLESDIKYILDVLDENIENTDFKKFEKDILIWKIDGINGKDILERLHLKYGIKFSLAYLSTLWKNIIPVKISKTFEDSFEDWYYTYMRKGTYKTCSCCGSTGTPKLAIEKYFSKNNASSDGLYSICKQCRSEKRLMDK